jgi:hypothetical protein
MDKKNVEWKGFSFKDGHDWDYMLIIPALKRPRQKASLGYIVSSRPVCTL